MSEADTGARSLFGLRKRAPKRPLTVTIILAIVVGFLLLSGPRELDEQTAIQSFQAYVRNGLPQTCGAISGFSQGSASRVESASGQVERFDVSQTVRLAGGASLVFQASVWPGIRVGPRVPTGEGRYTTLFQFADGVELVRGELRC